MTKEQIVAIMKREMKEQGLSMGVLSRKCGISYQAIQKWFAGKTDPGLANLIEVANVLGMKVTIK